MTVPSPSLDLAAVKQRQQQTWASGDFAAVGARALLMSELLCEAVDLHGGERVLDVATGSGNTALAAARRFGAVTGVDYVPALLERGRIRADAEGLPVTFQAGDAEALPFPDASFDVVLSTFGVMFAPNQPLAAAELLRVCRPGGRIGLTNWTPDGFAGELFRCTTQYLPPPPGLAPPTRWGTNEGLRALFGDGVTELTITPRAHVFRYPSPQHWIDFFRTYFGPTRHAFAALDATGQAALERDLLALLDRCNRADDGTLVVPSDYLEVVASRA
jgi:ubiquinone/menaquinone biosynthesis C-methylase UbiE